MLIVSLTHPDVSEAALSQPELQAERVPGDLPGVPRQALRLGLHRGTHRRQTVAQPVCVLCTGHGHTDTRTHTHTQNQCLYFTSIICYLVLIELTLYTFYIIQANEATYLELNGDTHRETVRK